jgi:hypothetical protein
LQAAAAWLTVNVRPATLIVPERDAPLLALALNFTDPLPVPEPPDVIEIQPAFDLAVHAHVPPAVTVRLPVPPPAGTVSEAGWIE